MWKSNLLLLAATALLTVGCAGPEPDQTEPAETTERYYPDAEMISEMDEAFLERDPKVGDPLPDVQGYAEDGSPLSLAELKGSYSVLVFGCLT